MTPAFHWDGDFPRWEDADENHYEAYLATYREGFDEIVDRLMALQGLERTEAEAVAENILMDDAA